MWPALRTRIPCFWLVLASRDTAHDALSPSHLGSVARLTTIALSFCRNLATDLLRLANGQKGLAPTAGLGEIYFQVGTSKRATTRVKSTLAEPPRRAQRLRGDTLSPGCRVGNDTSH